jgi:serine/threonine protein kinase
VSGVLPRPFGPYILLAPLGQGAAGAAYLARPMSAERAVPTPFVLKLLHKELAGQEEFVQRFIHEAEIAIAIQSPHVASVFDVGQVRDSLYIAMEYVPGWTLGRVMGRMRKQGCDAPIDVVHAMARDASRGLGALHDARDAQGQAFMAVHRDVSPKNLMVGEEGRTRVIDLGLMKSKAQSWQTTAGNIMGSPGYMAPEQIRGKPVDRRADLFALGVITHELLCNRRYIPNAEPMEMLKAGLRTPFTAPSEFRAGLSADVDRALQRAMTEDLGQRWSSALDFERALARCLPVPAAPEKVQDFLRTLLPEDFASRRQEVDRLVALAAPGDFEAEPTVVFVQRPLHSPAATPGPVRPVAVQGTQHGAPMQSIKWSQPFSTSRASSWPFVGAVAIALGIGFGVGAWVTQPEATSPPAVRRVQPPSPAATPRATVSPRVTPTPIVEKVEPAPATKGKSALRIRRKPTPSAVQIPPPLPTSEQRALTLQKEALALKARLVQADVTLVPQVDLLLARLAMLKAAGYAGDADNQLGQVAASLARLSRP